MTARYSLEGRKSMEQHLLGEIFHQVVRINHTTENLICFDYTGIGGGTMTLKMYPTKDVINGRYIYSTLDEYGLVCMHHHHHDENDTPHEINDTLNEILDYLLPIGRELEEMNLKGDVYADEGDVYADEFLDDVGGITTDPEH